MNKGDIIAPSPSQSTTGFDARIHASIDFICSELELDQFVRSKCFELSIYLKPHSNDKTGHDVPESVANAVACALVSIAHKEAWRMNRVSKYLPDRIIGKLYGISSSAVVYNKHLIGSIISKKTINEQKNAPQKARTLR